MKVENKRESSYERGFNEELKNLRINLGLKENIEEITHKSPSNLAKKFGALATTVLIASSAGVINIARAENTNTTSFNTSGTPAPGPGPAVETTPSAINDIETIIANDPIIKILEGLGRQTDHYEERLREIWGYKQELIMAECQEINLDACAEVCYSIDHSEGFSSKSYINKEKTILKNYITKEEVFEFGRTGKIPENANFQVIYFKDENGKQTNEIALFYVANPENKVFKSSVVQKTIDWWEERCPGYLETLVTNGCRVIFHSQAGKNSTVQKNTYGDGIYYMNFSERDTGLFENMLIYHSLEESFGICCDALGMTNNEEGLVKAELALLCFQYALANNNKDKKIINLIKENQEEVVLYNEIFGEGRSAEEINCLIEDAKKVVAAPFYAKSWWEIDEMVNKTATNK